MSAHEPNRISLWRQKFYAVYWEHKISLTLELNGTAGVGKGRDRGGGKQGYVARYLQWNLSIFIFAIQIVLFLLSHCLLPHESNWPWERSVVGWGGAVYTQRSLSLIGATWQIPVTRHLLWFLFNTGKKIAKKSYVNNKYDSTTIYGTRCRNMQNLISIQHN